MRQPPLKFAAIVALLLAFLPTDSRAQTIVSGELTAIETTWTAAGNPYHMTGDVIVPAGKGLTIGPGVTIIVNNTDGFGGGLDIFRVELTVNGALHINGTAASPVTMSGVTPGVPQVWYGIRVEPGFEQVSINHASIGGTSWGLSTRRIGAVVVANHVHYYDTFGGVVVADGEPQILASLFTGQGVGIQVIGSGQSTIANNVIAGPSTGIDLNHTVPTTNHISNNTIVGALQGIHISPQ